MTLVDTSAWVEFLRGTGTAADLEVGRLLNARIPIHTTDLVVAELLAGASDSRAADRIARLASSLDRCAPSSPLDAERAAHLFRSCRDAGEPVSLAACLLASVALRDDLAVLAHDRSFAVLARHAGLSLHEVTGRSDTAESPPREAPAPLPPEEPQINSTSIQILIVEDEPSDAEMLSQALAQPGWATRVAGTAREAREMVERGAPDVIVLDLILPDEDGRSLLPELRRRPDTRDAGIIVVTGRGGPRTRQECFALGANAFLDKPLQRIALAAAVKRALSRDRTRELLPDPVTQPLTLREIQARLQTFRDDPGSGSPLAMGLIEVHTEDDGAGDRMFDGYADPEDPSTRLARMLRRIIATAQPLLDDDEILGRWSADELLLVSPSRSDRELADLIDDIASVPELQPHLGGRVRLVGRDEDLLDAVSAMSTELREGRDEEAVAVGGLERHARPSVALVEDDPVTAGLVRHRLERSGFVVRHYEDGAEALSGIVDDPPHVAILDVQLPSMDGFEILGRMKEHDAARNVPVLVFTTLGREEHVSRAFQLGADDYVTKPFSPGELLTRVLRLVRKR